MFEGGCGKGQREGGRRRRLAAKGKEKERDREIGRGRNGSLGIFHKGLLVTKKSFLKW